MPNWCSNKLIVTGSPEKITEIAEHAEKGDLLNYIVPMPEDLLSTVRGSVGVAGSTEQNALYEFALAEWGTKWDIGVDAYVHVYIQGDSDSQVTIIFQSAWGPPCEAYSTLLEQDGVSGINATWFEPGCAFCGQFVNGDYEEITIQEWSDEWIEGNVPALIREDYEDDFIQMTEFAEEHEE